MAQTPREEYLDRQRRLDAAVSLEKKLNNPKAIEGLDAEEVASLRQLAAEEIERIWRALGMKRIRLDPEEVLSTLKTTFDARAESIGHGLPWGSVEKSLRDDLEVVGILADLILRRDEPTINGTRGGQIVWTESVANVPAHDFKGIPMHAIAYDAIAQRKIGDTCKGNAVDSARILHPRVRLATKEETEALYRAGLTKDNVSYTWAHTPDEERGNIHDHEGGHAWIGNAWHENPSGTNPSRLHMSAATSSSGWVGVRFSVDMNRT